MSTDTHTAKVLSHLQSGRSITPLEALREYGCSRLAPRIHDLKKKGHVIDKQMIEVKTRDGVSRVAEYSMVTQ